MIDQKDESNTVLVIVGIAIIIGTSIPCGYNLGVINNPASYIKDWSNKMIINRYQIHLSDSSLDILWSSIVSIFLVGGILGSICSAWLADQYGRKRSLLVISVFFLCGSILFQLCHISNSVEILLLGRFIVGLAAGLSTAILPMYITEISTIKLRGTLGAFCEIGIAGGIVMSQIVTLNDIFGNEFNWHFALSAYAVLVIICYSPSYYFPESPVYLYSIRNDRSSAFKELRKLRGNNFQQINDELDQMESYKSTKVDNYSYFSILQDSNLFLPLVLVVGIMAGQQLSGINAIFYYLGSIFKTVNLTQEKSEWASLAIGCFNFFASLFSPILMRKFNRRPLMMFSCGAIAILLLIFTFTINSIESVQEMSIVSIILLILYVICFQIALGPLPHFIGSELFETGPRPFAMSIGSLSSWIFNFTIGMAFPSLQKIWGAFAFLPFSISCASLFILIKLYLPETRNRDPKDIAPLISKGFRSRPLK